MNAQQEELVTSIHECIEILNTPELTPEDISMALAYVQESRCATQALCAAVEMYVSMLDGDAAPRVAFLLTHVRMELVTAMRTLLGQILNDVRLEEAMVLLKKRAIAGFLHRVGARIN